MAKSETTFKDKLVDTQLPRLSSRRNFIMFVSGMAVSQCLHALFGTFQHHKQVQMPQWTMPSVAVPLADKALAQVVPEQRKFWKQDFSSYFNVDPIDEIEVDPSVADLLHQHDISTDPQYEASMENEYDELYGPFIDRGFSLDKRFYVAFTGDSKKGYGAFADVDVTAGQVVGEYMGVITNSTASTDYQWIYYSTLKDQNNEVALAIDGRVRGNWLRFVNHADEPNCKVIYVPHNNRWHVLYIAKTFIRKGEELTVSYGAAYWEDRDKV